MKYCKHCNVKVTQDNPKCPLCQNELIDIEGQSEQEYPHIDRIIKKHGITIRVLMFISFLAVALCFAVNYLFNSEIFWSGIVAVGVICMWITLTVIFKKRHNIPKLIVWECVLFSLIMILLDNLTGYKAWSITYAMPSFILVSILAMWAVASVLRIKVKDYMTYMLIDICLGIVPFIMLCIKKVSDPFPSVMAVLASVITFVALFIFKDETLKEEIKRRLHL